MFMDVLHQSSLLQVYLETAQVSDIRRGRISTSLRDSFSMRRKLWRTLF